MKYLFAIYQIKNPAEDEATRDLLALCQATVAHGHSVVILSSAVPSAESAVSFPAGVSIIGCDCDSRFELTRMQQFVERFQAEAQKNDYEASLAFAMMPGGTLSIAYPNCASRRYGRFEWLHQLTAKYRFFTHLEEETLRPPSVTYVCCLSRNQEFYYIRERDISSSRLSVLPPQLDERLFEHLQHEKLNDEQRARMRLTLGVNAPDDIMVYMHATDWYEHGVDRAMAALSVMPSNLLDRIRFFVSGNAPGASQSALDDMARELGLPKKCAIFTGKTYSTHEMLMAADLLLFPARNANTGECIVEALLHGVPVVCTAECGYSTYAQRAGCPVIPTPYHSETLQDALAFSLPSLAVIRQSVAHFAMTSNLLRRCDVLLERLEHVPHTSPCRRAIFTPEFINAAIEAHQAVVALPDNPNVLKNDAKRAVTRIKLPQGSFIIKEFKQRPWWHLRDQMKRTFNGTRLLRGVTPYCWGSYRDEKSGSGYLIFFDCGVGNFYGTDYARRIDALQLYAECGKVLARMHTAGIYHADTKTTNFVLNENSRDECPARVCIVDCDAVKKCCGSVPTRLRIHNVAQFIASSGKIARADHSAWRTMIEAFRNGYSRHSHLSHADLDQFWQKVWRQIRNDRHLEKNLPLIDL